MNARLPRDMESPTIADLKVGATAYVASWAMYADLGRRLWLHPDFPFSDEPAGSARMRIVRTSEGFLVGRMPEESYDPRGGVSFTNKDKLPVIELIENEDRDDGANA